MIDCFNMAYQDNSNALHLNIKVNTENLMPISQKYHAGSLRVPADPSWPKIPQRKLFDDMDDAIEPPCIVTLSGTPRRSRTVIQTPLNQSPKSTMTKDSAYSSFHPQKVTSSIHTLKRIPGYADPRFKKVTTVKKNQVTSMESSQEQIKQSDSTYMEPSYKRKIGKSTAERDVNTQQIQVQEAERPHDTGKYQEVTTETDTKETKSFKIDQEQTLEQKHYANSPESKNVNVSENTDKIKTQNDNCVKHINFTEHMAKSVMNDANTQVDLTPLQVQENNGQMFFVLDKKFQSQPLTTIQLDTISIPQEYVNQCYNVQVPVLTYKNIPMQISPNVATNNVVQDQSNSECRGQNDTTSSMKNEPSAKSDTKASDQIQNTNKLLPNDTEKKVDQKDIYDSESNIIKVEKENGDNCLKSNGNSSIKNIKVSQHLHTPEKLDSTKIQRRPQESSDSEYYIPNTMKRSLHNNTLQCLNMKKAICNTSGDETTDSEFVTQKNIPKKECINANKIIMKTSKINSGHNCDQTNPVYKERSECLQAAPPVHVIMNDQDQICQGHESAVYVTKTRNKSEQNLPCAKSDCTKKLCRNSEPHIAFKQKKATAKFSRKARSYFQKNSHSALVDSDYTSKWPNCQSSKYKCSHTNIHKFSDHRTKNIGHCVNVNLSMQEKNTNVQMENNLNFIEQSYVQNHQDVDLCQEMTKNSSKTCLQKEHCKCDISPRTNTDDNIERPKSISPKTQELLNKSYWEYYNKLKHKMKNTNNMEQQYLYHLSMNSLKATKEKTDETYNKELQGQVQLNPELQTLQQCSALSSMINKALDTNLQTDVQTKELYVNQDTKSSSDPIANTQSINASPHLNDNELDLDKTRYIKSKESDNKFLELKSIIFFGGMMYILIIFLPMLYDFFYHEEYNDYENMSYLELVVDYVLSSFKEAFGDVFSIAKQIIYYPHACKKCNNIA